jgi:hypothetical protein
MYTNAFGEKNYFPLLEAETTKVTGVYTENSENQTISSGSRRNR